MSFEVIHKLTFGNQLRALLKERRLQVLDKIEILQEDPSPHEPLKKQLHGYKDRIYRLRSGDFRVIYTYGDGWVKLLSVHDRKDAYRGERFVAEEPGFDLAEVPKGDWGTRAQATTPERTRGRGIHHPGRVRAASRRCAAGTPPSS